MFQNKMSKSIHPLWKTFKCSMCEPLVTRHTSMRKSSSCHTLLNMVLSMLLIARVILSCRSATSRGIGDTKMWSFIYPPPTRKSHTVLNPVTVEATLEEVCHLWKLVQSINEKPKIYKNANGGFTTGLDLMSEDNVKVLEKRAERFGFENDSPKCTESFPSLYESLNVPIDKKNSAKLKSYRLNTIHMRGVEEMSTKDIFTYFKDYGPDGVEWINDYSCNVVWLDESTAARALVRLSKPLSIKQRERELQKPNISSYSLSILEPNTQKDGEMVMENYSKVESNIEEDKEKCKDIKIAEVVDIPAPPGLWRIGNKCPKANTLLLRFASSEDKKKPGSEKRSNYYKKYGNPNYGGLKGLISSSWKRKVQTESNRLVIKTESTKASESIEATVSQLEDDDSLSVKPKRPKPLRMRMYADDEELISKTIRLNKHTQPQKSVHSRLGAKFTKEDLCQIGRHVSPLNRDDSFDHEPRRTFGKRPLHEESMSDLRGKIKRLKNENASKHKSPLCRDD